MNAVAKPEEGLLNRLDARIGMRLAYWAYEHKDIPEAEKTAKYPEPWRHAKPGVDFPVADVLDGIAAAQEAGLGSIKVNMVVKRGTNEDQILPMARHFKGTGVTLRFIEYMDVGATNGWRMDEVLPSAELIERIQRELPLVPLDPTAPGETAERWAYADGSGEIGVISSVTQAFCGDCNRARLSTEGKLYLCLFASEGYDLRTLLRGGASDEAIASAIAPIWQQRADHYSELRSTLPADNTPGVRRVEMSYIGG